MLTFLLSYVICGKSSIGKKINHILWVWNGGTANLPDNQFASEKKKKCVLQFNLCTVEFCLNIRKEGKGQVQQMLMETSMFLGWSPEQPPTFTSKALNILHFAAIAFPFLKWTETHQIFSSYWRACQQVKMLTPYFPFTTLPSLTPVLKLSFFQTKTAEFLSKLKPFIDILGFVLVNRNKE